MRLVLINIWLLKILYWWSFKCTVLWKWIRFKQWCSVCNKHLANVIWVKGKVFVNTCLKEGNVRSYLEKIQNTAPNEGNKVFTKYCKLRAECQCECSLWFKRTLMSFFFCLLLSFFSSLEDFFSVSLRLFFVLSLLTTSAHSERA